MKLGKIKVSSLIGLVGKVGELEKIGRTIQAVAKAGKELKETLSEIWGDDKD